ncbi:MAG: DUF192 domain-containing protein [Candidatus Omnitrophica bacterium]|nr:DUF192 domain-containing protein [Candidatus Omnitrophota bacterium]
MQVTNKSKATILATQVEIADTTLRRVKGLLGRKGLNKGQALVIRPCNSIHTFFMQFPIDVLFMDKNNRVVRALPEVKPWRLSAVYFAATYTIELPAGAIRESRTQEGDLLELRDTL